MSDRIAPVFYDRLPSETPKNNLAEVTDSLSESIYDHNYDTFSFMSELLVQEQPLNEAFSEIEVDSVRYIQKYNGSNCAGLAQKLATDLYAQGVDSIVIPSFGETSPMDSETAYAGVKTTALLIRSDEGREYILDPALAIETTIPILDYVPDSNNGAYVLSEPNNSLLRLIIPMVKGDREMHFERKSLENADESMQKNWLRSRTKYKICRRYPNGEKDFITYEFGRNQFKANLGAIGIRATLLSPNEMGELIVEYNDKIIDTFGNELVTDGINRFIKNRQRIADTLLIPAVQEGIRWSN
jgi:hypothetical protein